MVSGTDGRAVLHRRRRRRASTAAAGGHADADAAAAVGNRPRHQRRSRDAAALRRARLHRGHHLTPPRSPRRSAQVLWDDLSFEREFYLIPRDTYATIPVARSPEQIPFDALARARRRRRRLRQRPADRRQRPRRGAAVQRAHAAVGVREGVHGHRQQSPALSRTRSRTRSTSSSGRSRGRAHEAGVLVRSQPRARRRHGQNRDVKEIYIADYDGANSRRITTNRQLNIMPVWSPDARASPTRRTGAATRTSSWRSSTRAFSRSRRKAARRTAADVFAGRDADRVHVEPRRQPRDLRDEPDGSNVRRLTNHPAIDTTPTWSPTGTQIAFTSDRAGQPQIYIVGADGLNLRRLTTTESYADRPTWSPAPFNEIAFAARTGPGYDIKVYDLATGDDAADHVRRGHQREPGVLAERTPPRVHLDARRARADLHDRPRRPRREAGHPRRQQLHAVMVELMTDDPLCSHASTR